MLRVVSIFNSISGEVGGFPQGAMAQFVRFGGCNLSCTYCDTKHTQDMKSGKKMKAFDIAQILVDSKIRNVVLTGGEPLLQSMDALEILVKQLHSKNFKISIETNGTILIPFTLRRYCTFVMDYKLDMMDSMRDARFLDLGPGDWIKFPIADRGSLMSAIQIQRRLYQKGCMAKFAYSPIFDQERDHSLGFNRMACSEASLSIINALTQHGMEAVLNLQIHKIIQAE